MTAVFRTMVAVLIPTALMHHMMALRHDLLPLYEGRLTEVTGLRNHDVSNAHITTHILQYILLFENPVLDIRHDELEYHINNQHNQQSQANTLQEHHQVRIAIDDDRIIGGAQVDTGRRCTDQAVIHLREDLYPHPMR